MAFRTLEDEVLPSFIVGFVIFFINFVANILIHLKTMKKIVAVILALAALFSCDKYDDSAVRSDIEGLESRVTALEQQCRLMNGNISALQALVAAVQGKDCVVSVSDLSDGTGYSITFASGRTVTLRNGKDEVRKRWC